MRQLFGGRSRWRGGLAWLAPLAALEVLGRSSPNDAVDGLGVVALALLAGLAWARRGERARERSRALAGLARRARERWIPRVGLDLRGDPPLEARFPRFFVAAFWGTLLLAACMALSLPAWPGEVRELVRGASGLVWLALLAGLWLALAAGALFFFAVPLAYIDSWIDTSALRKQGETRLLPNLGLCAFVAIATAAWALPVAWGLALVLGAFAVFVALMLAAPFSDVRLAWAPRGAPRALTGMSWRMTNAAGGLWLVAMIFIVAALAAGGRFVGEESPTTAVTSFLGLLFVWCATGACLWFFLHQSYDVVQNARSDPARPVRARVLVAGVPFEQRSDVRKALGEAGFDTIFGIDERADVRLEWSSGAGRNAIPDTWPARAGWARSVTAGELGDPALAATLRRRAELGWRRQCRKGITRALRHARSFEFDQGSGFWVGPHLWFLYHVTRDTDDEGEWFLGLPYRRLIPRRARHHLAVVLRALAIDLFFVEDGVTPRQLERILAQVFEFYDLFGTRPLDDRHFQGLPGVRVTIHAFPEQKIELTDYPEPDYDEISRARILHVFRDRGGERDLSHAPFDWDRVPHRPLLPVLGGPARS